MKEVLTETLSTLKKRVSTPIYGNFILAWATLHWKGLYGLATIDEAKHALKFWGAQGYNEWCTFIIAFVAAVGIPLVAQLWGAVHRFFADSFADRELAFREKRLPSTVVLKSEYKALQASEQQLRDEVDAAAKREEAIRTNAGVTERELNRVRDEHKTLVDRIPANVGALFADIAHEHQKIQRAIRQLNASGTVGELAPLRNAYEAATTNIDQMAEPAIQRLRNAEIPVLKRGENSLEG